MRERLTPSSAASEVAEAGAAQQSLAAKSLHGASHAPYHFTPWNIAGAQDLSLFHATKQAEYEEASRALNQQLEAIT